MTRAARWAAVVIVAAGAAGPRAAAKSPAGANEAFLEGNRLYQSGDFAESARAFERVLALGVSAPQLEYNLGNAYVKGGELGQAVLHYRRALRLDPSYESARKNLEYARSLTQDLKPEETPATGPAWVGRLRLGPGRAAAAVFLAVSGILGLGAWRLITGRGGTWGAVVQGMLGGVALLAAGALLFEWNQLEGREEGVVTANEIAVRSGPGEAYTVGFRLHRGTEVELGRSGQGWQEVKVSDRLVGWVPADSLETI